MSISFPFDGVQGCATHDNSLAIGVGHPSGVQCSSHGSCISGLCVCSAGWTGVSDMYDLDGLDCQVPRPLEQFVWALGLAFVLQLTVFHLVAMKYQRNLYIKKRIAQKVPAFYKYVPFRFLVRSTFAMLALIVVCVLKISSEVSIGRDGVVTILYLLGTELSMWIVVESQYAAFEALFKTLGNSAIIDAILKTFRYSYYTVTSVTLTTRTFVTLAGVFYPDETLDDMHKLVIARNLCGVFYFISTYVVVHRIAGTAGALVKEMAPESAVGVAVSGDAVGTPRSPKKAPSGKPISKRKVQRVIEELEASMLNTRKKSVVAMLIYLVLCTPQLYGFQGIVYALLTSIGAQKSSHNVMWYTPDAKSATGKGGAAVADIQTQTDTADSTTNTHAQSHVP